MSNGLLGMDVPASRELAAKLEAWPSGLDEVIALVSEAELLSDIPVGITQLLDSIGGDGAVMAAAIRQAADELESFTLRLDSPLDIARAVADVKSFRGTDNDPELDKRMRVLRELVEAHTSSDAETARVMMRLLAAEQSVDVRYRDTSEVEATWAKVEHLNNLEATGAISSNDPAIDDAVRDLRSALADHAATDDQANDLLYAFVNGRAGETSASALLASVLTSRSLDVVQVAHAVDVDYEIADGIIKLDRVDRLTASMATAPNSIIDRLAIERRELIVELVGSSNPHVLAAITEQLGDGASAFDVFAGLDRELAERAEAAHNAQVGVIGEVHDLGYAEAEVRLAEMTADTKDLVAQGWQAEDAAKAVQAAAMAEIDLAVVVEVANDPDVSLDDAITKATMADVYGMTVAEYDAYLGLDEFFDEFDTAFGGDADGIVSVWDLAHVVNNDSGKYSAEQVAAAVAVLAAPGLRNRLDSARDHGNVVGHEPFGADHPQDHKFSIADMRAFAEKQLVNFVVSDHVDAIDVANQGGDLGQVDGTLRKEDFEAYLASPAGAELDDRTRLALEHVIAADWHDQDWWERNGDSVILVAAVVAGAATFAATAGASGPLVASMLATAAGANTGAVLTVGENLATGDPLHEDFVENTLIGATGGLAGAGLAGGLGGQPTAALFSRVATRVGIGADVAGLVAAGVADPLLEHVMDDITLQNLHGDAQAVNYLAGGLAVGLYGVAARGGEQVLSTLDEFGDEGMQHLVPTSTTVVGPTAAATRTAAEQQLEDVAVEAAQRVTSRGLDVVTAAVGD